MPQYGVQWRISSDLSPVLDDWDHNPLWPNKGLEKSRTPATSNLVSMYLFFDIVDA